MVPSNNKHPVVLLLFFSSISSHFKFISYIRIMCVPYRFQLLRKQRVYVFFSYIFLA